MYRHIKPFAKWLQEARPLQWSFNELLNRYQTLPSLRTMWSKLGDTEKGFFFEYIIEAIAAAYLRPGDVAVDAGANYGCHTFALLDRVGASGAVLAFEPNPMLAAKLRGWNRSNLQVIEKALSDHTGSAKFFLADQGGLHSLHVRPHQGMTVTREIVVPVVSLDDALQGIVPRLIKADVEGEELAFLRGAKNALITHRPLVLVEIDWPLVFRERQHLSKFLAWCEVDLGYLAVDFFGRKITRYDQTAWNIALIPAEVDVSAILTVMRSAGQRFCQRDHDWTPQKKFMAT